MRRLVLLFVTVVAGCNAAPPLQRSCNGQTVGLCAPYEYAEVSAASLDPSELTIADFSMNAMIHVELSTCDMAPAAHVVDLEAVVPAGGLPTAVDGGSSSGGESVMSLLTLRDDGRHGDMTAGDGVIDVTVTNPFINTIPAMTNIVLRFTPRSTTPGGCSGPPVEISYRTGPMRPSM